MKYLLSLTFLFFTCLAFAMPSKVEMQQNGGQWLLTVNGAPYYVKGVGGSVQLDEAVACGANTIRTWGLENAKNILDEAESKGLKVMMGIWMAHERHGFNYSDEWAVKDQLNAVRKAVEELKDHPALLMWGVGNEVDLFYSDLNVWTATENLAAMIQEVDPNHPTCCVTAGIDVAEVQLIKEVAPSIDILGVNTYGGITNLRHQIDLYGWEKPYMVTEWGPTGHWEVAKTTWGAPIEDSSTEKARDYAERYEKGISLDAEQCIGSFVFLWGQKQETTPTWYGVFLESGYKTGAIDVLYRAWNGKDPATSAPEIEVLTINDQDKRSSVKIEANSSNELHLIFTDADNDVKRIHWEVLPESNDIKAGGDVEKRPETLSGLVNFNENGGEYGSIKAPSTSGAYRLFVYIEDNDNKVATTNIPFWVD